MSMVNLWFRNIRPAIPTYCSQWYPNSTKKFVSLQSTGSIYCSLLLPPTPPTTPPNHSFKGRGSSCHLPENPLKKKEEFHEIL